MKNPSRVVRAQEIYYSGEEAQDEENQDWSPTRHHSDTVKQGAFRLEKRRPRASKPRFKQVPPFLGMVENPLRGEPHFSSITLHFIVGSSDLLGILGKF